MTAVKVVIEQLSSGVERLRGFRGVGAWLKDQGLGTLRVAMKNQVAVKAELVQGLEGLK